MEKLADRVAWAITKIKERSDLTDVRLGELLGVDKNTVGAYRKKEGLIKGSVLEGLAKHFDFNSLWLLEGKGEPFPDTYEKHSESLDPKSTYHIVAEPDLPPDEFVFIRQMKGKISAGGGLIPDNAVQMRIAFRKDWINKKGNPQSMSLIKVSGDSMEPSLQSGDLVLVDHSRTSVEAQGGIYAISMNQEIMIKRIQVLDPQGRIAVISDNKNYARLDLDANQIHVNGKVIWFCRDIER